MRNISLYTVVAVLTAALCWTMVRHIPVASTDGTSAEPQALPPTPAPPPPRQVTICAVGDVMLDRNVGRAIQKNGCESIVRQVAGKLRAADITFTNLECPLSTVGAHSPSNCVFRAKPETVKVLTLLGVDIVSLANNHTLDAGREGLLQTLEHLDKAGVLYCGAARRQQAASQPVYLHARGVRVAFVAFTDLSFAHGSYSKVAGDMHNLCEAVSAARELSDIVVVSLHWGEEYRQTPTQRQRQVAHAAIDAGADLIVGHHPHTLEGIEIYKHRPILYSMGNFIFDQRDAPDGRMESAVFDLTWNEAAGWRIQITPVWIARSRMGPQWPTSAKRDKILRRIQRLSAALGTDVQLQGGCGYVTIPPTSQAAGRLPPASARYCNPLYTQKEQS